MKKKVKTHFHTLNFLCQMADFEFTISWNSQDPSGLVSKSADLIESL